MNASQQGQDGPVEDMHEITEEGRLAGLLAQVRSDAQGADVATVERLLRDRLADTGVELQPDELTRHAKEIAG